MNVGIAVVGAGPGHAVYLFGWQIIPQPVPAVIGEPEFAGFRVPGHTDGITYAGCVQGCLTGLRVHTQNAGEARVFGFADVAGGAYRNVQEAVGTDRQVFPAVMPFVRKVVCHNFRFGIVTKGVFNRAIPEDPVQRAHVQVAADQRQAAGQLKPLGKCKHLNRSVSAGRYGIQVPLAQ